MRPPITRSLLACLTIAPAIALVTTGPAQATTYCVASPACAGTAEPDLQSALTAAQGDPAPPSAVQIGPGTFSSASGFKYLGGHTLTVTGAGAGATTLTATTSSATVLRLLAASPLVKASGFTVAVPQEGVGASIGGTTLTHVAIVDAPGHAGSVGVSLESEASEIASSTVAMSSAAEGVTGLGSARDDRIEAGLGVLGSPMVVQRTVVRSEETGMECDAPTCTFDSDVIELGPTARVGIMLANTGTSDHMLADGITVVGGNPATVAFEAFSGFASKSSALHVDDSIVSGPGQATVERTGNASATAEMFVRHSDLDLSTNAKLGFPGQDNLTSEAGNVNVTPGFVDAAHGRYQLMYNSPLIDAGDPEPLTPEESTTDLAGNLRLVDGDADADVAGTESVQDIGAYEYQRRAPVAAAALSTTSPAIGQNVTFDGTTSSDPDPGDTLTYAWHLDDGTTSSAPTFSHAFATAGAHQATLTVTDPTGLSASTSLTINVPAPSTTAPASSPAPSVNTFSLTLLRLVRAKLRSILRHGVRATVSSSSACTVTLVLTVDAGTARRAHLSSRSRHSHSAVIVGRARVTLAAGRARTVTIAIAKAAAAKLAHLHSVKLTLGASASGPGVPSPASASTSLTYR